MTGIPDITIPADLLPKDGRFGSGPSRVGPEALNNLAATGASYMGTSHRQSTVKDMVGRMRQGISDLFALPDDWEVLLGNGGTTVFWDAATFGLIDQRSQHLSFGEFSSKFAKAVAAAPHLGEPEVIEAEVGGRPQAVASDVDLYALTHNETSTGVAMSIERPTGADGLVAVDATSAAGGIRWAPDQADVYYFAPQKCLASDGGLWLAACSPAALERIETIRSSDRWCPASIDLGIAMDNSLKNQTYNTPALATIFLTVETLDWMNSNGGMEFSAGRSDTSSAHMYGWADASDYATPFVAAAADRSPVVATIDLDEAIPADTFVAVMAANGVRDIGGYRKLGRNQIRVAMFPGIDPEDIVALTACFDHVAEALS